MSDFTRPLPLLSEALLGGRARLRSDALTAEGASALSLCAQEPGGAPERDVAAAAHVLLQAGYPSPPHARARAPRYESDASLPPPVQIGRASLRSVGSGRGALGPNPFENRTRQPLSPTPH